MSRKYTKIDQYEKQILSMREEGKTHREIAESLGLEKEQIKKYSEIFEEIVREGRGSWIKGKEKEIILLYWRNPQEWAGEIYRFVGERGGIGSIYTIYDLIEGDDSFKEGKMEIIITFIYLFNNLM